MDAAYLRGKFQAGLEYDAYLSSGTDEQRQRWAQFQQHVHLSEEQAQLLAGFVRQMNVIAVSGIWCGDCVQQVPLINAIGQANPEKIQTRYLDRDAHSDLQKQVLINGGQRVPVAIFAAEDFEPCGWFGDRTLNRYRHLYARSRNPACETGLGEVDAMAVGRELQDWVDQFERIQYLLCLSPRLREKHGD